MTRRTDWRPAASRTRSGARPILAGREAEYGVHLRGDRSRDAAVWIIHEAARRYPAVGGSRHGGTVEPSTIFTDNEVLYLDAWSNGGRPRFTLEAAGYECDDPWMLHLRAVVSEARIRECAARVEERAGLDQGSISVLALADDFYRGRTRGYHFNVLMTRVMEDEDQATLALWLAASSALLGAGGLGGRRGVVCDSRIGHLNASRGASLAHGNRVRGLYSIGRGDTGGEAGHRLQILCQGSTRLSMILSDGMTLLILRALEEERLQWKDPLIHAVSQMQSLNRCADPLAFRLRTVSGMEIGVLEVLRWFGRRLEILSRDAGAILPAWSRRLIPVYQTICRAALAGERLFLARRLDSWMKWRLYDEMAFERHGLSLPGLARWMPVAALLGREGLFRRWDGTAGRRGRRPRSLAEVMAGLPEPPRLVLERLVDRAGLEPADPGFPRYMEAIRDLADLEFRLGSAREDNPLPALIRCGYAEPLFGEPFRVDPATPPPAGRNRSRARSVLIRRHKLRRATGCREVLYASWNQVVRDVLEDGGDPRSTFTFDLRDPLMRGIPRARKAGRRAARAPRTTEEALMMAGSFVRICSGRDAFRRPSRAGEGAGGEPRVRRP